MTKHTAQAKCASLWGHLGQPFTRVCRKAVANRFQVGYLGHWPNNFVHIMGAGPSWEAAFGDPAPATTHVITGYDKHTTPEGVNVHRWICSCDRRGKWTTAGLAESAGCKHARAS